MPPIRLIAYASSSTRHFSPSALEELLAVSRRNNERDGLTGLLLHRGGNFLQAIEGPESAVIETMSRISRDPRHRSVIQLLEEYRDERLFGEWTMGFEDAERLDLHKHPGVSAYLSASPTEGNASAFRDQGHDVLEFFQSFRQFMR